MAVYTIADNGLGISKENTERVFDMFYRLNPTGPAEGDGLGLSIVKKIVDRHNGKVWLESKQDEGTNLFIALPIPK